MSVRSSRATQLRVPPLRLVRDDVEVVPYDTLIAEAQEAELHGRNGEARDLYELALRRIADAEHAARASDVLRWIARSHRSDGQLDLALDCAEAAQAVAEAFGDVGAAGHATNLKAIIRWQQGDLDEAERLYEEAREKAIEAGEAKLAAMTSQNLGVVANIRGELDLAARHYETSLAAYRELGLASDVCVALNNLGLLHSQRERWADAARAYDEAHRVAEVLGDRTMCMRVEVNRAEGLVAQGEHALALAACDRARRIAAQVKEPQVLGELHKAYGVVSREMGDYDLAEQYLADARAVAELRQDFLLLAESFKESAELHRRQGRNRDTLQALNRAHRLFDQLRARRELADVGRRMVGLESDFIEVVRRWGESIECKDQYTQGHCERVAALACGLAARTGMDEQSLFWFRIGALLHDVGKLVIPAEVLNKAGRLTEEEWTLMRRHPVAGVEMLADVEFPWDVRPIVESHHERWDGAGYPHQLSGEAIPLVARILCIADVYDALTSGRSYKKAMSHSDAMDVMRLQVGTVFDPALFPLFEDVVVMHAAGATHDMAAPARAMGHAAASTHPDELTQLPLRGAFNEMAAAALASRSREEKTTLLLIDIDHFKLINDTFGHQRGDAVLRAVAHSLRRALPDGAQLARYGGDEFLVLLPDVSAAMAVDVGDRLRRAIHSIPLAAGRSTPIALTISIGAATAPEHGTRVDTLFGAADRALYDAKRQGRDMTATAGGSALPPMPLTQLERFGGRVAERQQLAEHLQRAVRGERQVVAVVGEAGVGKSALVRAVGPDVHLRAGSVVTGHCIESDTRPAYAPWGEVLDAIRVLRVVPEQREWTSLPQLVPSLGGAATSASRLALFEDVAEFLRLACGARPLMIVLEDMQWADAVSWDLLEFLAARLDRERLLFTLTLRADDVRGEILTRRSRLSRDPRFHELRLGRLSPAEQAEWLTRALQQPLAPSWLDALYARSEGNPFLAVQDFRAMLDQGLMRWTGREWQLGDLDGIGRPVAARDLFARRLARLSPTACRTLGAAAILGRTIDLDRAIAAGIGTEDDLLDAIDEGLSASVLEPSPGAGDDSVSFTHGFIVELLHEHVHPRRLRRIRDRVAPVPSTVPPAPRSTLPSGDAS
jgi:diguanylate cyclase (GGDEF)-like protein/putative nucleotidyltransferase with HDIG domain